MIRCYSCKQYDEFVEDEFDICLHCKTRMAQREVNN